MTSHLMTPSTDSPDDKAAIQQRRESATWTCSDCGRDVTPIEWELGRTRFIRRQFCDCAAGQANKEAYHADLAHEEWIAQAEMLVLQGGLSTGDYDQYRFGNWDRSKNAPYSGKAFDSVNAYVDQIDSEGYNWVYLWGEYGLGKTHLAVAAVRKIAKMKLWKPHIVVWTELCQSTQESWRQSHGPTEGQLWGSARSAQILLIDDLDKTSTSEWAMGKLFNLVNYRQHHKKPTIITANRSLKVLKSEWKNSDMPHVKDAGAAVLSRITGQLWGTIEFQGVDIRGQR